jgi:hypothetical protein
MDFDNQTALPAVISRAALPYRDLTLVTVVLKASYEVAADGSAQLVAEQLPVNEADAVTPLGGIDADVTPIKDGIDLALMGHAHAPDGRATPRMDVSLSLGDVQRSIAVFGARVWESSASGLRPSAPQPFVTMPLTYAHAFGGLCSAGELEAAYDANPEGKGFIHLEKDARGSLLPNLEESDQLIKRWDDHPLPAGFAPLPRQSTLRLARGADVDLEAGVTQVKPALFSWCHPRMRLAQYPAAQWLHVRGMCPEGDWRVRVPELYGTVTVRLGECTQQLALRPDSLCAFPGYSRLFVLARVAFLYQFTARQLRSVTLNLAAPPDLAPPPSIAQRVAAGDASWLQPEARESPIPFELLRELYPLRTIVEQLPLVACS